MRVVRYERFGGPEVLRIEQVPTPEPGPGQVLIGTEVIGTSWVDTAMRRGTAPLGQPPLPGSPHGDVVGTVRAVGDGVDASLVGRRVCALVVRDAYADAVLADTEWLVTLPDGLDAAVAGVLDMPAPTALGVLRAGRPAPGETVLVHSAAGTVGLLAAQLARREGATVVATVGSPDKIAVTRAFGAADAVVHSVDGWTDAVRRIAPQGVDVVLDSIGGELTAQGLELLNPFGRLVVFGAASGELPKVPTTALFGLRTVTGFGLMGYRAAAPERARADLDELTALAAAGRLRVPVQATLPLDQAAEAHRLLEDRSRVGRVLLVP